MKIRNHEPTDNEHRVTGGRGLTTSLPAGAHARVIGWELRNDIKP